MEIQYNPTVPSRKHSGQTVIFHCGSGNCLAGFAGDSQPQIAVSSVVGYPKMISAETTSITDSYVGAVAQEKRKLLNLSYPVHRGVISNWDDMEILMDYMFHKNGLNINTKEHGLLFTIVPNNPPENHDKLIELIFEQFQFPTTYLASQAPLALFSYGKMDGLIVDSGEAQTHIVPICEGRSNSQATQFIPMGGKDLNNYLKTLLDQTAYLGDFLRSEMDQHLYEIKKSNCYVPLNFKEELAKSRTVPNPLLRHYKLPDNSRISLGTEHFRCAEMLFNPQIIGLRCGGLHENIQKSIDAMHRKMQPFLYANIYLTGGNTMLHGFKERLELELSMLKGVSPQNVHIEAAANRHHSAFRGASLISILPSFQKSMITAQEYDELGSSVVRKKYLY